MKTIRIKFVGFYEGFTDYESLLIFRILNKHFNVEVCDNADYIICSCFGVPYDYLKYPQIRIMITEENYIPDLNFVDYAISPYPINFLDRCFCFPTWVAPLCAPSYDNAIKMESKVRKFDKKFLEGKEYFANFIFGHESEFNVRGDFFNLLSQYRRIESPGKYLNNMQNSYRVLLKDNSKIEFQKKCKFSICFESTKHEGFVTEKITDAFFADTIPIYYGSKTVTDYFNPDAFINCNEFANMQDVVEYVEMIDNNDDLYLSIINQPVFRENVLPSKIIEEFEKYVIHIFTQPYEKAFRRSQVYHPKRHEDYINNLKSGIGIPFDVAAKGLVKRAIKRIGTKTK